MVEILFIEHLRVSSCGTDAERLQRSIMCNFHENMKCQWMASFEEVLKKPGGNVSEAAD